jgi:hypothetical protein
VAVRVLSILVLVGCASSSTPRNAHPEWGQCGFAQMQHLTASEDPPKCRAGDLDACVRAAEVYREGGYSVPRVPGLSAELAWPACRAGRDRACAIIDGVLGEPPGTCATTGDACAAELCTARFDFGLGLSDDARRSMRCP